MGRLNAENSHSGTLYPVDSKSIYRVIYEVVAVLPTEDIKTSVIYCVPIIGKENEYDMYLYIDGWVPLGSGSGDLSDYYTKEEIAEILHGYYTQNDIDNFLSTKMSLTPLNPTTQEIEAMLSGQLYGDTANHKGTVKDGQSFYDTVYIDENYRKTYISSSYRPPIITLGTTLKFSEGDKWVFKVTDYANHCSYTLVNHEIDPVKGCVYYFWKPDTNAYRVGDYMPITQIFTQRTTEGETWYETPSISVGDVVIKKTNNKITAYYICTNTYFTYSRDGYETQYMEVSVPENYYTKTEINTMIGDIETALSEV